MIDDELTPEGQAAENEEFRRTGLFSMKMNISV